MKIALVGSGLCAIGAYKALQNKEEIIIDHYTGNKKKEKFNYKYSNGQPVSSLSKGGLSNYWHGVIPVNNYFLNIPNYSLLLNEFYKIKNLKDYSLFIPHRPIRGIRELKKFKKAFKGQYNEKSFLVDSIETHKNKVLIQYNNRTDEYDLLILAIGDIEASKLLKIKDENIHFYDHINGLSGYSEKLNNKKLTKALITKNGHLKKVFFEDKNLFYSFRPVIGKLGNLQQRMSEINYGQRSLKIIFSIFKSLSVNKINEAIYNRFGFSIIKTKILAFHFQHTVKVTLNENKKEIIFNFSEKDFYNLLSRDSMNFDTSAMYKANYNFYPGTHIRAMVSSKHVTNQNIITAFLPEDAILSPYHHSFLKMVNMHNKIKLKLNNPN